MTDPTEAEVLASVEDGVGTLVLNRPDRLNAWTPVMAQRYGELLAELDADQRVRAIVVTGAGRGFCAGGDLGRKLDGTEIDPDRPEPYLGAIAAMRTRKPTIAAINGACAGVGLTVALCCDIRFADATAKLSTAFARRGRVGTPGLPWLLARIAGPAAALDLLMSGRTFSAAEAHELRLVNFVSRSGMALPDALGYAGDLALSSAPRSMSALKSAVMDSLDTSYQQALATGARLLEESRGWPEATEGVASFTDARAPRFPPLP